MTTNLTEKKIYCNFFMKIKIISHNIFLRWDCRTQNSAKHGKTSPLPNVLLHLVLCLCVLFLISGNLNAQVEYGLKGGFTYSGVDKKIENSLFYSTRDKKDSRLASGCLRETLLRTLACKRNCCTQ
jgi:hypothetical protein